jgi:hypothetical protein
MRIVGQIVVIIGVIALGIMVFKTNAPGQWDMIASAIAGCGIVIGGWALIWSGRD